MRHLHQFMIVLALVLMGQSASAYDFMVDGIAYNVLSEPSDGSMGSVGVTSTVRISTAGLQDLINYPGVEEFTIPETVEHDGKTYQVTQILKTAFARNNSLAHVLIPNTVTEIGEYAFFLCTNLKEITIPESVNEIGQDCFDHCGLESATILGALEIPRDAFWFCKNLKSVEMPNVYGTINFEAFEGCSNLRSVVIPDGVTQVRPYAFKDCTSLESIHLGKSVQSIGIAYYFYYDNYNFYHEDHHASNEAFINCPQLSEITVSPENPYFDSRDNCNAVIFTEDNSMIFACKNTFIPTSVKMIFYAFHDIPGLQHIDIPESIKTIYCSFRGIEGVEHIEIPEGTNLIFESFIGCSDLRSVKISSTVQRYSHSFMSCDDLERIVVSPENEVLDSRDNCNAIIGKTSNSLITGCKTTIIPSTVKEIAYCAFEGCKGLTTINIPAGITEINTAFGGCDNLRVLHYDARGAYCHLYDVYETYWEFGQPYTRRIGLTPFLHSNGSTVIQLDTVIFGPEVKRIFQYLLWGQKNIKRVELPASVEDIEENAFGNSCIEEIVIPKNILHLSKSAFSNSTLKNVYCLSPDPDIAETEQVSGSTYTPFDNIPANSVLHVPHGRKENFQQHPGWSSFKEIYELTDVNCDNLTDIADVNQVINVMLGKSAEAADVNGDGKVDIADVNAIINAMLGKE